MDTKINIPANTKIESQPRPKSDKATLDAAKSDKKKVVQTNQIVKK